MSSFRGVERRFDFKLKSDRAVLLSDYAHHPAEIAQSIRSIRELYEGRKVTVLFQPHLYSRTNDFYREFADSLSLADEVILTEIYPARELPIPGVTSQLIFDHLRQGMERTLTTKQEMIHLLQSKPDLDVVVVLGAGDLNDYVPQIKEVLENR